MMDEERREEGAVVGEQLRIYTTAGRARITESDEASNATSFNALRSGKSAPSSDQDKRVRLATNHNRKPRRTDQLRRLIDLEGE